MFTVDFRESRFPESRFLTLSADVTYSPRRLSKLATTDSGRTLDRERVKVIPPAVSLIEHKAANGLSSMIVTQKHASLRVRYSSNR